MCFDHTSSFIPAHSLLAGHVLRPPRVVAAAALSRPELSFPLMRIYIILFRCQYDLLFLKLRVGVYLDHTSLCFPFPGLPPRVRATTISSGGNNSYPTSSSLIPVDAFFFFFVISVSVCFLVIIISASTTSSSIFVNIVLQGTCYDHLEWWQQQPSHVQLATTRTPDGLEIIITGMTCRIMFDWYLLCIINMDINHQIIWILNHMDTTSNMLGGRPTDSRSSSPE